MSKHYRGQTTHTVWDHDVPLHEWVEGEPTPPIAASLDTGNAALERWLQQAASVRGSSERPITWLFHPDSFEPMAKLVGDQSWSIVGVHHDPSGHRFSDGSTIAPHY